MRKIEIEVEDKVYQKIFHDAYMQALENVVKNSPWWKHRGGCSLEKCKVCYEDGSWCNLGKAILDSLEDLEDGRED